jgi:argininosuccinate lyase
MKLWGGNYEAGPDAAFWEFNRSFAFDRRLLREEILASRAYARAIGHCGAIPADQAAALDQGLALVLERAQQDPAYLDLDAEDVHSFVEARLGEVVGDLAGQGHLGRSRNEQAVTALRLWIREAIDRMAEGVAGLVRALAAQGEAGAEAVMPGFTHTRAAEPITFGHFAGAHAWALVRDRDRLMDTRRRVNVLPLGSGALAGTALPIDRSALAAELGFEGISQNALDAVSDRDFAAEFVFACAQLQTHLARLSEDLIWLSGPEFGFFKLPESFTTGSSLMPQKKNPDALELVRGKAGRVDGDLVRLLVLMKGLPVGYQKDMQEDKEAVFDAADTTAASVSIMTGVVAGLAQNHEIMARAAAAQEMIAAGLAVALARDGMPFRGAHALVGSLVAESQRSGETLLAVAARLLPEKAPAVAARVASLFDPREAVRAKAAPGGTAPDAVRASLAAAVARVRAEPSPKE